jgi:hypothetical protein
MIGRCCGAATIPHLGGAAGHGHLSNDQTVALLEEIGSASMRHVIVGHISEQNNSAARISEAFAQLSARLPSLSFATRRKASAGSICSDSVGRAISASASCQGSGCRPMRPPTVRDSQRGWV